jgi:formate dehydrogenase subunit gamma
MAVQPDDRRPVSPDRADDLQDPHATVPAAEDAAGTVERNNWRTRWFHAGVYLLVIVLLITGWWLTTGHEGEPTFLAKWADRSDAVLHTDVGYVLAGLAALGIVLGWRAVRTLVWDSVRFRRAELRWFVRWPKAVFTGRFGRHDGHFDPGQRIANIVMLILLLVLVVSGIGLDQVSGGPAFVWWNRIHRWSTYIFTPVIAGHILIAAGVLPGYRGVWRAMHVGGRLRTRVAARLWPAWLERRAAQEPSKPGRARADDGAP